MDAESGERGRKCQPRNGFGFSVGTPAARALAEQLLQGVPLPDNAAADALHIGIATANGMDYLLTWNCAHIANAAMRQRIEAICRGCGYQPPVLCTPEELMED
jgi:hypothetical protein